jgi:hypothetical protein
MMLRILVCLLFLPSLLFAQGVVIADSGDYYHVVCDLASAGSRYQMGLELGQAIATAVPGFGPLVDSYLAERSGSNSTYNAWISRMGDIWPQVPQEFRDEVDGMTDGVSADSQNIRGDGKLSRGEIRLLNLFPDCARSSQCAGLAVFGDGSASGHPMTARLLDWHSGNQNQLGQIQAVITVRNGDRSVCLVGFLGYLGAVTGLNDDGLFAGILDSPSGAGYSSAGRRSYAMDIRKALEDFTGIEQAAEYLSDTSKHYAYNHLVLLSDSAGGAVLENNISGNGTNMRRGLRRDTSALNPGVEWGFEGAVAAVNSFVLYGNHDNHTGVQFNTGRWASFRSQMAACGQVDWEELKSVAGFDNGNGPGYEYTDIYNAGNVQIICFRPDSQMLEVAFKPRSGTLPGDPVFLRVPVCFDSASGVAGPGHSEPGAVSRIRLYPNPCRDLLCVDFREYEQGQVELAVYDIAGRRALSLQGISKIQEAGFLLDTGRLKPGVYIIRCQAPRKSSTARFVKGE